VRGPGRRTVLVADTAGSQRRNRKNRETDESQEHEPHDDLDGTPILRFA
jgi:hypothetical protein